MSCQKTKNHLQQNCEMTPYDSQMFVYKFDVMTLFTHYDWLRVEM